MFPWAIHCHDCPCCDGIKAIQGDGAAAPGLSLHLRCQLDFSEVLQGVTDGTGAKAASIQGGMGRAVPRHLACSLPTMNTRGGSNHPHCASQHILFAAMKVRS